jgi:hypothetical protein
MYHIFCMQGDGGVQFFHYANFLCYLCMFHNFCHMTDFPGGTKASLCVLAPGREPTIDQTVVPLYNMVNQWVFIGVTNKTGIRSQEIIKKPWRSDADCLAPMACSACPLIGLRPACPGMASHTMSCILCTSHQYKQRKRSHQLKSGSERSLRESNWGGLGEEKKGEVM